MRDRRRSQWWVGLLASAVFIATAIAFDDARLTKYQLTLVQTLLPSVAAIGTLLTVLLGAVRYLDEREEELKWRQTSFVMGLFKEFDQDEKLRRAQELIDRSRRDDRRLHAVLRPIDELHEEATSRVRRLRSRLFLREDPRRLLEDRLALDRYLDFFDRLFSYIFHTNALGPKSTLSFSGYVVDILLTEPLARFALEEGYEDVLRLALLYVTETEAAVPSETPDPVDWVAGLFGPRT